MEPFALIRRALLGFLGAALGLVTLAMGHRLNELFEMVRRALFAAAVVGVAGLAASPARANEVSAAAAQGRGIVIHPAGEVLERFCQRDAEGRLWFALPSGARFELITSATDPAILNPGDGTFHPFEESEVRAALAEVKYPLEGVSAEVYLLPYPRRNGLESAAGPGLILLSPGVRAIPREHQHAEFVHELGHVVQYARMPDSDVEAWGEYRRIRGITDTQVYNAWASHADRPHEIFAEDFRALFGGGLANYAGTIENSALAHPAQLPALPPFLLSLEGTTRLSVAGSLAAWPNPARGALHFSRVGGAPVALEVFDAAGRRVTTILPSRTVEGWAWGWDGRDAAGRPLEPGVVFARLRDGSASARVTVVR